MKRRKALSLLLILTLLLSPALPAATAYAAEGSSGMEISKTATANEDGSYTVTLEAYATGAQVITNVTTEVPTDIVLVLDQSGSMANPIGSVSFDAYTGSNAANESLYSHRHNGGDNNLWHRLEDGSHVSVSVAKQEVLGYTAITNQSNSYYFINQNNLYARVNGAYQKVTVTFDNLTFTYTLPDGTQIASLRGAKQSPTFTGIDGGVLYLAAVDNTATIYTYTYTDLGGNVQTIGTSTGENTRFTEPPLYQRTTNATGGGSRLNALRTAATYFINAVAEKAAGADGNIETTADNINHRIAVVGFASASGYGNNTELLSISGSNSGNVGVAYNDDITNQHYIDVVQNMDTAAGQTMVHNAINALAASGATRVDLGMTMAKNILDNNPVSANEQRNRVVIVFTDGSPTSFDNFDKSVANAAILASNNIKNSGATVYSIGVFSGADATSAGAEPSGNLNSGSAQFTAACNWFMQQISSNNGTPQTPSYYLSAADADALNNIFQQISDQIETGGTSSTLTSEAVVKDIISPQFTLPAGADASSITLETYACTGEDAGVYTWLKNDNAMGAAASIEGDQVSVTGFNFSENYVGTVTANGSTTYRGHKLVIRFNVWPKAGFLGGNDVFTNTSAGIYANDTAEEPLLTFDRPTVNVPIKDVTVEAQDKNVYLMGAVTAEALKADTGINVGNVSLDLTQENYGLEPWQTEYVNIEVAVRDAGGTTVSDTLENLDEDTTYTVEVTVTPKTDGEQSAGDKATEKIGNDTANINVFCPELTFKDSTAYYGETVPTDFSGNPVGTKWKHDGTEDDSVVMLGDKPTPEFTYTPDESKLGDGKFTKQEVPVAVMVRINQEDVTAYTTFVHRDCDPACGWQDPASKYKAFLIHIKTCTLKITKQGGAADEPYVFDVYKDGVKYSEVTVWGNGTETLYELPVGNYTIVENEGWSWRYTAVNVGSAALSATNPDGSITCENEKKDDLWLNGFSAVVRNIFGMSH